MNFLRIFVLIELSRIEIRDGIFLKPDQCGVLIELSRIEMISKILGLIKSIGIN